MDSSGILLLLRACSGYFSAVSEVDSHRSAGNILLYAQGVSAQIKLPQEAREYIVPETRGVE
jgi:hypothetical protein